MKSNTAASFRLTLVPLRGKGCREAAVQYRQMYA
jgi:hypothetical protein